MLLLWKQEQHCIEGKHPHTEQHGLQGKLVPGEATELFFEDATEEKYQTLSPREAI